MVFAWAFHMQFHGSKVRQQLGGGVFVRRNDCGFAFTCLAVKRLTNLAVKRSTSLSLAAFSGQFHKCRLTWHVVALYTARIFEFLVERLRSGRGAVVLALRQSVNCAIVFI